MPDLLADVTVVEVAGELNGYAGRLLADLGAHVTLVGDPGLPEHEHRFLHHGKATCTELAELLPTADVVLLSGGADAPVDLAAIRAAAPDAVVAVLTPYGLEGPRADCVSTDLTRLAAGGLLWLGGYPDGEPVAVYGGQSSLATGIYGAVAVLLALLDGRPATIEVSAQEVLTQALETSLADYELTGVVRRRAGSEPREAGTGVYPCADGYVSMVAGRLGTAEAWTRLREWLVEEGTPGAHELWADGWNELPFRQRPESVARFSEIFGAFAATRSKQELYAEAQRRSIALAPVNSPADVLADPQLAARGFFRDGLPTAPYRISTPVPAHDAAPTPT
jgi:benzylsuccinate CoA-transferase BbsE subunit